MYVFNLLAVMNESTSVLHVIKFPSERIKLSYILNLVITEKPRLKQSNNLTYTTSDLKNPYIMSSPQISGRFTFENVQGTGKGATINFEG